MIRRLTTAIVACMLPAGPALAAQPDGLETVLRERTFIRGLTPTATVEGLPE